ncbi:MAG: pitrilysin family protein [Methanomethylophilus sp.]
MISSPIDYDRTAGGIPVLAETLPGNASAGYMVTVRTGSRDETAGLYGISHLLEHTVFRASSTRTSFQMAKEMEGAGGELNAFTGKEVTAFFGVTLKETADVARKLVADIVADPQLSAEDTALEKEIVLQELSMVKSEPEEYIHDLFEQHLWAGSRLGQDEGGTDTSVRALDEQALRQYYEQRYGRPTLAVFATGAVDIDATRDWAEGAFDGMQARQVPPRDTTQIVPAVYHLVPNHAEHYQVAFGFPTELGSEGERMADSLLSAMFGAGTSSRMFQQVREKQALVYAIYNAAEHYSDAGYVSTFFSCTAKNVVPALESVAKIYGEMLREGPAPGELARTKNLVKGAVVRSMESTEERLVRLCRDYMSRGRGRSLEQIAAEIEAVTDDDLRAAAQRVIDRGRLNVTVLGAEKKELKQFDLNSLQL